MTRMVTITLGTVLAVVVTMSILIVFGVKAAVVPARAAQGATLMSDREKFVGTYRLSTVEVKDTDSVQWAETPDFNRIG